MSQREPRASDALSPPALHFVAPRIIGSPQGSLLEVRGSIEGTDDFNAGSLYQKVDENWREVDTLGWQKELAARLPKDQRDKDGLNALRPLRS